MAGNNVDHVAVGKRNANVAKARIIALKTAQNGRAEVSDKFEPQVAQEEVLNYIQQRNKEWYDTLENRYQQLSGATRKKLDALLTPLGFDGYLELLQLFKDNGFLFYIHDVAPIYPVKTRSEPGISFDALVANTIFEYLEAKSEGKLLEVLDKLTPNAINVLYDAIAGDVNENHVDALVEHSELGHNPSK